MKVAFVLDDSLDSTDGVQQYVRALGEWFSTAGHEVHYLVGHTERRDIQHIYSMGKNVQVKFNKNRMSTPLPVKNTKIRRLLSRQKYDVLHIQMPYSPFFGGRVINQANKLGIPVVATFHILPASRLEKVGTRILGWLQQASVKKLSGTISVSEPAKQLVDSYFSVNSKIIPNPVNIRQFNSKSRSVSARTNITFLGRLVERKGCYEFLKAVALLDRWGKLQDTAITVCGDGPLRHKLTEYVKRHKLGDKVSFTGYLSEQEKVSMLQATDIAVFPSLSGESFGIVLLEAMAAGVDTVIAGDNPGYRWVMSNNEQQLVDPRNRQLFAAQLQHYMSDHGARKKSAKWQQQRVRQFDVSVVAREVLRVYDSVIAKK